jgi:ERCC4-type nuclease
VDRRAGSAELQAPLLAAELPVEMDTLPAGDVELHGRGPGGRPLLVGVEYKAIRDLLTCVRDGRFAEQLRGMRQRYEVCWLLVEGEWRLDAGMLEVRERQGYRDRGGYSYQEVAAWTLTMAQRGGVLMWRTRDREETVAWLRALYWWWTCKDFEEHRAHLAWYTPPYTPDNPMDLEPPSVVQKVAAALLSQGPTVDVNAERAKAAAAVFPSVAAMVAAGEREWRGVEGIGPKIARRVVASVQ